MDSHLKKKCFFEMLRIRMVEEAIAEKYKEQKMRCPVHLSIGQEAIPVGVCAALSSNDYVMNAHRAHAHYLAKGGNLNAMIAEIYGKSTGCTEGKGGSMHLIDLKVNMYGSTPIVGSSIPVAVGLAFASWLEKKDSISTVFFGDGASEEGVFFESINFAALKKLPVLFICENNLYSVYSPLSVRQAANRNLVAIAKAHGLSAFHGDGNNIEEVNRLALSAVETIRSGNGPVLLEFDTYRFREHCGPNYDDEELCYRPENEIFEWKKRCPIENYKKQLLQEEVLLPGEIQDMTETINQEIQNAFQFAQKSPFPLLDQLSKHVYA